MPFIAFLGCDGSGKSAVIQGVAERLAAKGTGVSLGHWRPKVFVSGQTPAPAADNPHGQVPRGLACSVLKLGWLWLNWWLAWFGSMGRSRKSGVLLFDRYHADLLVDPARYRYGGPLWLAGFASWLMPQPDRVVFLDAEPEVLFSRKQEVALDALRSSRERYRSLCKSHVRFVTVDASQPLNEVIADVLNQIKQLSGNGG